MHFDAIWTAAERGDPAPSLEPRLRSPLEATIAEVLDRLYPAAG
jgi:hypothetical protein